ncbi:MAG: hypothetical protein ACKO85_15160 [Isosphaeraceae bacterium]
MILRILLAIAVLTGVSITTSAIASPIYQEAKKAEVIPADKAREHLDKSITTELTVKSAKDANTSKVVYLDSEENYKAENNLALVIPYATVEEFKKAGVEDVIKHFMGKKIRVTGKVIRQSDQTRIVVSEVKQIELVK